MVEILGYRINNPSQATDITVGKMSLSSYSLDLPYYLRTPAGSRGYYSLERASADNRGPITFTRDVAPILFQNCAGCHRPDDIAPFSVLSYKDVRPWARSIKEKVVRREMPPWHADPHYGQFSFKTKRV
jgi:hypothetical protein